MQEKLEWISMFCRFSSTAEPLNWRGGVLQILNMFVGDTQKNKPLLISFCFPVFYFGQGFF